MGGVAIFINYGTTSSTFLFDKKMINNNNIRFTYVLLQGPLNTLSRIWRLCRRTSWRQSV
jgi:hypothetical protein